MKRSSTVPANSLNMAVCHTNTSATIFGSETMENAVVMAAIS